MTHVQKQDKYSLPQNMEFYMLVFFLSLACGPKKEIQTPVEIPEEVAVSEEPAPPELKYGSEILNFPFIPLSINS